MTSQVQPRDAHASLTYELCHGVMFTFGFNGASNAVVFQDGEEKLHKVRGVGGRDDIQYLWGAQPVSWSDGSSVEGPPPLSPLPPSSGDHPKIQHEDGQGT